ncbi:C40 family peptidase [Bacillus infantis]|uniref:C40 family peptidase n=1 Tax=Bacillus infantis TaxID=324767 RepID=UPI001CD71731|nr:C40 family peptidase [Bacillus infantis]MCA1039598.1 C40 family peptidase [Bacillus infantis]
MGIQHKWLVNVPVATIWTSPESAREIDGKAVSGGPDMEGWLAGLTYETRLALCNENRIQTQALFGQEVILLEEEGPWASVIILSQPSGKNERGYPGWMPKSQLMKLNEWNIKKGPVAAISSKKAVLYSEEEKPLMELSFETVLPAVEKSDEWLKVRIPEGYGLLRQEDVILHPSLEGRQKGNGGGIVSEGERFLGLPYLWGGMSSWGFDCSGFSYTMCKANGYIIPRDAHDQARHGTEVDLAEIQPGDLLFFAYQEGKGSIHHVGIFYGDGKLLHSPNTGKTIEIIPLKDTIYEKELCAARRYWQEGEG